MARTPGSINQNIHFKTREAFDFNLLYNEKELNDGTKPPEYWFQRLIELSKNPPYIIACKTSTAINIRSFHLSEYINENLIVNAQWESQIDLIKPSGRNNDSIETDILNFTHSITQYYLNHHNLDSPKGIILIRSKLLHLKTLCALGNNNVKNGIYYRKFLVSDGHTRLFQQVQTPKKYTTVTDHYVHNNWASSMGVLWDHLSLCVDNLQQIFGEPVFEPKKGYKKVNFENWLEKGLCEFLELKGTNITDEVKILNLLKWQILGKREFKPLKKIK